MSDNYIDPQHDEMCRAYWKTNGGCSCDFIAEVRADERMKAPAQDEAIEVAWKNKFYREFYQRGREAAAKDVEAVESWWVNNHPPIDRSRVKVINHAYAVAAARGGGAECRCGQQTRANGEHLQWCATRGGAIE